MGFPSPCGVWVVSVDRYDMSAVLKVSVPLRGVGCFVSLEPSSALWTGFRPLAGCGLFHKGSKEDQGVRWSFRPLAGCGLFHYVRCSKELRPGFRPLAGCGLFLSHATIYDCRDVSVPLRGVGCFRDVNVFVCSYRSFRPLAGCGLFPEDGRLKTIAKVSVPLRGVGCFKQKEK